MGTEEFEAFTTWSPDINRVPHALPVGAGLATAGGEGVGAEGALGVLGGRGHGLVGTGFTA